MARDSQTSTMFTAPPPAEVNPNAIDTAKNMTCLPTEIWLQILEYDDHQHLWLSVRNVARTYRDRVERLFASKFLVNISITLSLPRRDPATGKMKWPGDPIPRSQLNITYRKLNEDGRLLRLESSAVIKDRHSQKSVVELKDAGTLPKERLEEAPAYVNMSTYSFAGITVRMPVQVDWDEIREIWTWDIEWRKVLSGYYAAKEQHKAMWVCGSRV